MATVEVCSRCGHPACWATGKATCQLDGIEREVAIISATKAARIPVTPRPKPKR